MDKARRKNGNKWNACEIFEIANRKETIRKAKTYFGE
jgi:hypothetical protein